MSKLRNPSHQYLVSDWVGQIKSKFELIIKFLETCKLYKYDNEKIGIFRYSRTPLRDDYKLSFPYLIWYRVQILALKNYNCQIFIIVM